MNFQNVTETLQSLSHDASDVVGRVVGAVEDVTSGPARSIGSAVKSHRPSAIMPRRRRRRPPSALAVLAVVAIIGLVVLGRRRRANIASETARG